MFQTQAHNKGGKETMSRLRNLMSGSRFNWLFGFTAFLCFVPVLSRAAENETEGGHGNIGITLLSLAILWLLAKMSSLIERFGQPAVLGELLIGVIIGNLSLIGFHFFEPMKADTFISFLAEIGVIVLLFQVGLESNIEKMKKVGLSAFLVAVIGVVVPFVIGTWLIGPWVLPGLPFNAYLFLGASLTATSVGITARVFKDLKKLHIPEAQIVLGAAVIDDVIGLIILAVVSALASLGAVSFGLITWITAKAILFLVGAIVVGQVAAPHLGHFLSKVHTGIGMKLTLAMSFCFALAAGAQFIGLAPIVGAFAAGLVLDPVHFKRFRRPEVVEDIEATITEKLPEGLHAVREVMDHHTHRHVEELITPIGHLFVPLFFVVTGMGVKLETFADVRILTVALAITVVAFLGKIVAGLGAGKVDKWLVGWGMVPRGEVGLIFAAIGKELGVVSDSLFSVIVIMVILSTLLTPPILTVLLRRSSR